jgi:hypothetical protein
MSYRLDPKDVLQIALVFGGEARLAFHGVDRISRHIDSPARRRTD